MQRLTGTNDTCLTGISKGIDDLSHTEVADVTVHFPIAIAIVSGGVLMATFDKTGYYHDIISA